MVDPRCLYRKLGLRIMESIAVLVSGGMDSSILTVDLARQGYRVFPVYLQHGLIWEPVELDHLERFLSAVNDQRIESLTVLKLPVDDMYNNHWSVTGKGVPDESTDDDAVYLPGRNLLLLAKMAVWCSLNDVSKIAMAPLKGNPFSDNSDQFYSSMQKVISLALESHVDIVRPYSSMSKDQVIVLGEGLPLELTFSCIRPRDGIHCGRCNKCAERKSAYRVLVAEDSTPYFDQAVDEIESHV